MTSKVSHQSLGISSFDELCCVVNNSLFPQPDASTKQVNINIFLLAIIAKHNMSSASASSDYSRSQSETSSSGSAYRIAAQIASRSREMMCTHITMVRMYADDMRCSMCLQPGPFGWLYRCTQDRELMIEEDYIEGDKVRPSR